MEILRLAKSHLNITATLLFACSLVYSYVTLEFWLYIGLPAIALPAGDLEMVIIETNVLSMFFFGYILRAKGRSLLLLLFFVPAFLPFSLLGQFLILYLPFWLAGFVVLLSLKMKKSAIGMGKSKILVRDRE
jgi:hypothetical protein